MTIFSQSVSTAEHDRLLKQLRDWCAQDRGRQTRLANELRVPRQTVSLWLTDHRKMTLNQWTQVQQAITQISKDMIRPPLFPKRTPSGPVAELPEPHSDLMADTPRSLGDAKVLIAGLRAKLTQSGACGTPPAAPHVPSPSIPARSASPALAKPAAAKAPPALSISDLLAKFHAAEKDDNVELANHYRKELVSRATPPDNRPPAPKLVLPSTPKKLEAFFADQSTAQLKSLLGEVEDSTEKFAIYKQLKARGL